MNLHQQSLIQQLDPGRLDLLPVDGRDGIVVDARDKRGLALVFALLDERVT